MLTNWGMIMNITQSAAQVTSALCVAYLKRNRRDYPVISDDPHYAMRRLCNMELDTLTTMDRQATIAGFNLAFDQHLI